MASGWGTADVAGPDVEVGGVAGLVIAGAASSAAMATVARPPLATRRTDKHPDKAILAIVTENVLLGWRILDTY